MNNNTSLQQSVDAALLPSQILAWLETLPEEELMGDDADSLLLRYLQFTVAVSDVAVTLPSIHITKEDQCVEMQCQRWLRWFLLDYDDSHPPAPAWKARYLLFKAMADDLHIRFEQAS